MRFSQIAEFTKEFKKLQKKYKSLPNDLKEFQKIVSTFPLGNSRHFNILTKNETACVVKARFFCRYLKGNSLRIIYIFSEKEKTVSFLEIYSKNVKVSEDEKRIKRCFL